MKQTKTHIKTRPRHKKRQKRSSLIGRIFRFGPSLVILATAYNVQSIPITPTQTPTTKQVLSYATSMSTSDLLASTNAQRSSNGIAVLGINSMLNSAAQAKANDMITLDYWSHTTPGGKEPWTFIADAGYGYKTAGENLAYGFDNGSTTITGWMNSPPHRQNLLNTAFTEVGFGFANSANYVTNGPQTVVVAMYAAPLSGTTPAPAQAASTAPTPPAPTQPAVKTSTVTQTTPAPAAPAIEPVKATPAPEPAAPQAQTNPIKTASTAQAALAAPARKVSRIQIISGKNSAWSNTLLILSFGSIGVLWVLQKGIQLRRSALKGERFVLKHLHMDLTVISLFVLGATLLQTTNIVR